MGFRVFTISEIPREWQGLLLQLNHLKGIVVMELNRRQFTATAAAAVVLGNLPVATAKPLLKTPLPQHFTLPKHQAIFLTLKDGFNDLHDVGMDVLVFASNSTLHIKRSPDRLEIYDNLWKKNHVIRPDCGLLVIQPDCGSTVSGRVCWTGIDISKQVMMLSALMFRDCYDLDFWAWGISSFAHDKAISTAVDKGVVVIWDGRNPAEGKVLYQMDKPIGIAVPV